MSDGGEDMQSETEASLEEFLSSGRTGRRNALADVADAKLAEVSVAGLSGDFSGIAVQDVKNMESLSVGADKERDGPKDSSN